MLSVFAGRKGGSGKSSLACNLAPLIARESKSIVVIDNDPQATTARWGQYRTETDLPKVSAAVEVSHDEQSYARIVAATELHDHVFLDTQGNDSPENRQILYQLATRCTCPMQIIVPVKPSQPDLDTLEQVLDMLTRLQAIRPDIKVFYVLNESPTTTRREREEALMFFNALGITPISSTIHARKAYRDSMAYGKSVVEMNDSKAAEEIKAVYRDIFSN